MPGSHFLSANAGSLYVALYVVARGCRFTCRWEKDMTANDVTSASRVGPAEATTRLRPADGTG